MTIRRNRTRSMNITFRKKWELLLDILRRWSQNWRKASILDNLKAIYSLFKPRSYQSSRGIETFYYKKILSPTEMGKLKCQGYSNKEIQKLALKEVSTEVYR